MKKITEEEKFDYIVENSKIKVELRFNELAKRVKHEVFKSRNWESEKEVLMSQHKVEIKKMQLQIEEQQRLIEKQATQIQNFKAETKNLQSKTYQDLINDENDKLFIKFVGEYKIQADDKVHFVRKIDEMVEEIDKCIEMLQSK